MTETVTQEVRDAVQNAIKVFESLGAVCEEVDMTHVSYSDAVYYIISSGEAASSMARYDGVRFGHRTQSAEDMIDLFKKSRTEAFGAELQRRNLLVTTVLTRELNEQ